MRKNTKVNAEVKNNENEGIEAIMKTAEVTVEKKTKKTPKTFKDIVLHRIDMKAKNLPDHIYDPIREQIAVLIVELQNALDAEKNRQRMEKTTFKRLSKFNREDIAKYLESLNQEVK
jgi:hypothetical protein